MTDTKASLRGVPDASCEPLSKLNSGAISNFSFHIHGEGGHVEIKGSGEVFVSNLVLTDAAQLFWSAVSKMGVGYKTRCEELEAAFQLIHSAHVDPKADVNDVVEFLLRKLLPEEKSL